MTEQRTFFGTDGIRCRIGQAPLYPEFVMKLGWAIANELDPEHEKAFFIGRDTRNSGPMLWAALVAGITSAGSDVIDGGVFSTPGVAFVTRDQDLIAGGIVISASHNPHYDNGIKLFNHQGAKLSDQQEQGVEKKYLQKPSH